MSLGHSMAVFRLRRVKWKIMLPFVLLTGLFALFATKNITELVTSSLEDRLDSQLVGASQHAADVVAKRERDQLEVVRAVANTEGVWQAVNSRDRMKAEALILPAAANAGAEHVEVFGRDGWSVYGIRGANAAERQTTNGGPLPSHRSAPRRQWIRPGRCR